MKTFIASFGGVYLRGDALVTGETKRKAFNKLKKELSKQGLGEDLEMNDLEEIDTTIEQVIIIDDGNY